MSAISENIDLNTDVVLSDHENGARTGNSRLDGLNEVVLDEVRVVGGYKEGLESEFKEENVDEAKEVKMEDRSLKESVEEDKGSVSESRVCVVNSVLGSSSSDCLEGAIVKEVSLEAEMGEEGFAEKERNAVEDSDKGVSCSKIEVGTNLGSDLVANERDKEVSIGVEMDKVGFAEREINAVEDSGTKLDETSSSQSLEVGKEKEDFAGKEEEISHEAEMDKKDSADVERKAVEDSGAKLDEMSRSQSLEAEKEKEDFAEKETKKDKKDLADVERKAVEDLGTELDETCHLQSLESEKVKEESAEKEKEVSLEVEKNKKDFAELESKAVEDLGTKIEALPSVSEVLEPKSLEATESATEATGDVSFMKGETKVNLVESTPKSNADECSDKETVVATESEGEMKADPDESLPKRGSEVIGAYETVGSGRLRNGTAELHPEATPKSSGSGSDSIGIVIDLNPKKGSGKGKDASRKANAKSAPSKHGFSFGDLIWGKVRSHPWWPGQICDPSIASKKAKKHFKRDTYLIAYYGDNTFAWNEVFRMKPFVEHFSHMEKQSNTEDFHYAIDCALEEVSRRVEFGLACSCLSEEVYSQIETQTIVNAGIREELSAIGGGDSSLTAASFDPVKLVEYIKELAQTPNDGAIDKLEFAVSQSELLAFARWKGYTQLPEFTVLGLILESDADVSVASKENQCDEPARDSDTKSKSFDKPISEKGKSEARNSSSVKRKLDSKGSASPTKKKKKNLSDLTVEKRTKIPASENGSKSKAGGKKRKAIGADSVDSPMREPKSLAKEADSKPLPVKQSFRVGERISKVASRLNASSLILKNGIEKCKSSQPTQTIADEDKTLTEEPKQGKLVEEAEKRSYDEAVARISPDPTGPPGSDDEEDKQSLEDLFGGKKKSGKKPAKRGRKPKRTGMAELPHELGETTESYWSERIGKSIPEDQGDDASEALIGKSKNPELELDSEDKVSGENLETQAEDGLFVTALILNFSDPDSVPSRANLNKIFSSYESLDESKTEVLKNNRAKVVFKKRSDAETAFSSAGKFSTFGRSLVSYRLKYMSSSLPNKASPDSKKQSNKDNKASEEA